jgi:pyruvate,water dikinase
MADACHTRRLTELRRADEPRFGGKSAGLGELLAGGIPVPDGFAVDAEAFRAFTAASGIDETIAEALEDVAPDDVDRVAAASRRIGDAIRSAPVPEALRDEVAWRCEELAATAGAPDPAVAVRSSAVGEDSAEATFAGQQETYLWIRGAERVCAALRDCWASLYGPPAISYRARLPAGRQPAMGVTVQLMVDAAVSGVLFTCNPVSGDPSMVAINASWGLGLAVVGGEVTPDDYLVSKVTREVVRERISRKDVEYVPDAGGSAAARVDVAPDRRDAPCLDAGALRALVDVARRVERHFGCPQDVEWAIARGRELPDGLYVVQSRPVTTAPERRPPAEAPSAVSLVMSRFGAKPA